MIKASSDLVGNTIIAQYFYDGSGQRIKKVAGSSTTRFVYGVDGTLLAEYEGEPVPAINSPTKENIYAPSGLLAVIEANQISYLTPDHLGSPRVITDSNGVVTSRRDFYPFGEMMPDSIGNRFSVPSYSVTDSIKQRFTGYFRDEETDLDFAQARYMNSSLGRFISTDPLGLSAKVTNPQTWNRYAYVTNNPVNIIDPLGLAGIPAFLIANINNQNNQKKQTPSNIIIEQGEVKNYEGQKLVYPDKSEYAPKVFGFAAVNTIKVVDEDNKPIDPSLGFTIREKVEVDSYD